MSTRIIFRIHVPIIMLQIMRAYNKRKTGDGLTSLDEMNTAVKEVLLEGKKCRTVAKAHAISEATLRRYCPKVQYRRSVASPRCSVLETILSSAEPKRPC